MNYEAVAKAKNDVQVSKRLDGVAVVFRTLIRACIDDQRLGAKYGFSLAATDVADDLHIDCAHGQVRLVYDQVYRDEFLRGRFTFLLLRKDVLGETAATEIHSFLFNDENIATWNASGNFEWTHIGVEVGDQTSENLMDVLLMGVTGCIPVLSRD